MVQSRTVEEDSIFLTLAAAARRAGRSYSWAWERAVDGRLDARRFSGRRIYVTATSLKRLLTADQFPTIRKSIEVKRGAHLRLVVSNP